MTDAEYDLDDDHEHTSKEAYERVQSIIDKNTGGEQPIMLPKTMVRQIVSNSNLSHEQANRRCERYNRTAASSSGRVRSA